MKVYNKLVRDKVPQVIKQNENKTCKTRMLDE